MKTMFERVIGDSGIRLELDDDT